MMAPVDQNRTIGAVDLDQALSLRMRVLDNVAAKLQHRHASVTADKDMRVRRHVLTTVPRCEFRPEYPKAKRMPSSPPAKQCARLPRPGLSPAPKRRRIIRLGGNYSGSRVTTHVRVEAIVAAELYKHSTARAKSHATNSTPCGGYADRLPGAETRPGNAGTHRVPGR